MAIERTLEIKTKIVFRHNTEAQWAVSDYIPYECEQIIYDPDDNYNYSRIKYGDGSSLVKDLPFVPQGEAGLSTYVRYSATEDGAEMTTDWSEERAYMGVAVAAEAPSNPEDYTWSLFANPYTPSGWTVSQIGWLEQIFEKLVYTDIAVSEVADSLISSLRNKATDKAGWTGSQIEQLEIILKHLAYTDDKINSTINSLITSLKSFAVEAKDVIVQKGDTLEIYSLANDPVQEGKILVII